MREIQIYGRDDITKEEADAAHDNYLAIVTTREQSEEYLIFLGKLLYDNRRKRYYNILGYDTFLSFIASPEIAFSKSTAYNLINIYEKFILELRVPEPELMRIPHSKLIRLLPVIDKENKEMWLERAEALSVSDLEEFKREARGQKPKWRSIEVCPICTKLKVYKNNICECREEVNFNMNDEEKVVEGAEAPAEEAAAEEGAEEAAAEATE